MPKPRRRLQHVFVALMRALDFLTCSELKLDGINGSLWTGDGTVAIGGEFAVGGGSASIRVVSSPLLGIVTAELGRREWGKAWLTYCYGVVVVDW